MLPLLTSIRRIAEDGLYYVSSKGSLNDAFWNIWEIPISRATGQPAGPSRQITHFADSFAMFPKLVDGAKQLVFLTKTRRNLFTVQDDRPGAVPQNVIHGQDGKLSPDGETLFYMSQRSQQNGIFRMPVAGGTPQMLVDGEQFELVLDGFDAHFEVSPEGHEIVFTGSGDGGRGIYSISTDGSAPAKLLAVLPNDATGTKPMWSPDGRQIAYTVGRELHVMNRDGSGPRPLATLHAWEGHSLQWSPDGHYLASLGYDRQEDLEVANAIFVVSRDGTTLKRLTSRDETEYKEGLRWHPDGKRLTYMRYGPGPDGAEIRWAYLEGRATELFIDLTDQWDYVGTWAPDGDRFYFLSFGEGDIRVHLKRLSTGTVEKIPGWHNLPTWSRDESAFLFTRRDDDAQFWLMEDF